MEECKDLKQKYDDCFNSWFSKKFLRGNYDDRECADLLKVYKECVVKAMKEQNLPIEDIETMHIGNDKEKTSNG